MWWTELHEHEGQRTIAAVLAAGDEVSQSLQALARDCRLQSSHFTAIGAFERVVLGFFAWDAKDYERIELNEQVEVLSLVGDVTLGSDGDPVVHAHVVVGKRDGSAHGGHLLEADVRPTLEVVVVESPAHLRRRHDPETGLDLIRIP